MKNVTNLKQIKYFLYTLIKFKYSNLIVLHVSTNLLKCICKCLHAK